VLNKEQFNFDYTESWYEESQFSGLAAFDMVYMHNDNSVLMYGGITGNSGFSDTLYVLENYKELKVIQTIGDIPSARIGHTFTKINENEIVLIGGVENTSNSRYDIIPKFLNDIHILHINNDCYSWEKIEEQHFQQPCPRESHTTVLHKNHLIIYGGMNGKKRLNDVWMLDLNTFIWIKIITNGTIPIGRSMHTATLVDHEMYIFGGYVHEKSKGWKCTNSMQCLDLQTYKWRNYPAIVRPAARTGHAAFEHYGRIYIFSGRDDSEFNEDLPIKCHNDVWCFETRKPLKVTSVNVVKYDRNSFKLEWSESINAILYVVEIKEEGEIVEEIKDEPMVVDEDEVIIIEDHPENIVVEKAIKQEPVTSKKPKIIIHENILLTPPNTINTDYLFNRSPSQSYEIVNLVPEDQLMKIDQMDGTTDLNQSESTDSELETYLASKNKNIQRNCWYLAGIFKTNSCKIKNYNSHVINRNSITSDRIPNLIGSKIVVIEPGKTYNVRIGALNSIGLSEMSDVISVTTKKDDPINNLELINFNDVYTLKWCSIFTEVEFLVSFEMKTENHGNHSVTLYRGTACQCEISKQLIEKTRISDHFAIGIRAISSEGQVIYGTELQCSM
jgi:host cell factor